MSASDHSSSDESLYKNTLSSQEQEGKGRLTVGVLAKAKLKLDEAAKRVR
jgi:hypothetical protein